MCGSRSDERKRRAMTERGDEEDCANRDAKRDQLHWEDSELGSAASHQVPNEIEGRSRFEQPNASFSVPRVTQTPSLTFPLRLAFLLDSDDDDDDDNDDDNSTTRRRHKVSSRCSHSSLFILSHLACTNSFELSKIMPRPLLQVYTQILSICTCVCTQVCTLATREQRSRLNSQQLQRIGAR